MINKYDESYLRVPDSISRILSEMEHASDTKHVFILFQILLV